MAAPSRPRKRPTIIDGSLDGSLSASSSSEEEAEKSKEEGLEDAVSDEDEKKGRGRNGSVLEKGAGKKAPAIISSLKKFCNVCKEEGHWAGFLGANYIDCPRKPCFLCKMSSHTAMSCPHRVAFEHRVVPALRKSKQTQLDYVFQRQLMSQIPKIKHTFVVPDKLDRGIVKFHSRRVTSLEFHPTRNNVLISGDKKGQIGIWDYSNPNEKTVYGSIHSYIVNNMKFDTRNDFMLYTSSSDGTISYTDLETGIAVLLIDVNTDGWNGRSTWRMLYGMDSNSDKGLLLAADNFGYIYQFDTREKVKIGEPVLIHRKRSKVVGLHCNPTQPDLLLSCGNDHFAHMWDIRRLETGSFLASLAHTRVVNSAYFSPHTGSKILTTSQDNRIRVWDSVFGNLNLPSREIVHSHDFHRRLTPFRAEWDPKDPSESLAVIGRYMSENYNGMILHPIDFIDTSTGHLVARVVDPDLTTISPVNKLHHRDDILATGSSSSVFIWRPGSKDVEKEVERKKKIMFCNACKKRKIR